MAGEHQTPDEIRALLRITCADAGVLLSDYHDGVLAPDDHARVAAHVRGCVACGVILEHIGLAVGFLRAAGSARAVPEADDIEAVVAAVLDQPGWPGSRGPDKPAS